MVRNLRAGLKWTLTPPLRRRGARADISPLTKTWFHAKAPLTSSFPHISAVWSLIGNVLVCTQRVINGQRVSCRVLLHTTCAWCCVSVKPAATHYHTAGLWSAPREATCCLLGHSLVEAASSSAICFPLVVNSKSKSRHQSTDGICPNVTPTPTGDCACCWCWLILFQTHTRGFHVNPW